MQQEETNRRRFIPAWRAIIETALLVFLFYSVRLMWEFTAANGRGKIIALALKDIFTSASFLIAISSALIGCAAIEYLRKKQ